MQRWQSLQVRENRVPILEVFPWDPTSQETKGGRLARARDPHAGVARPSSRLGGVFPLIDVGPIVPARA